MIRARRVDANQAEIVAALRKVGASVQSLTAVKGGCPDLLVGWRGKNWLFEVKIEKGTLTPDEAEWQEDWGGQVLVINSVADALSLLGCATHV